MNNSPIKSVLRNLTDKRFFSIISSHIRIVLEKKGTPGDTAKLSGDVFRHFESTAAADGLMDSILTGKVALTYVIDNVVSVEYNSNGSNFSGNAKNTEAIRKRNSKYKTRCIEEVLRDAEVDYIPPADPEKAEEPVVEKAKNVTKPAQEQRKNVTEPERTKVAEVKEELSITPDEAVVDPTEELSDISTAVDEKPIEEPKKAEEPKPVTEKKSRRSKQIVLN